MLWLEYYLKTSPGVKQTLVGLGKPVLAEVLVSRLFIKKLALLKNFLKKSSPAQIFKLWETETFDLLVSCPILQEYKKALSYPKIRKLHQLSGQEIAEIIDGFKKLAIFVDPRTKIKAIKADPKDNMFLECALNGKADFIVSGDKHLLELKEYQGIQILTPHAFLLALSKG